MKFTKSPEVELRVGGKVLSIQQDNDSFHVGTSVWPCSLVLVMFAHRWLSSPSSSSSTTHNPYSATLLNGLSSKRAVELGAGCGVAGMGMFLLGLTDLVLTDISPVMPALRRNLKRNKAALSNKTLKHAVLYWNNLAQIASLKPPFDIVIATDVVYIEDTVGPLLQAMDSLLSPDGFVLLGYQIRSPEAHQLFWQMAQTLFTVQSIPHDHLHPDYAYQEADVFVLRKKNNTTTTTTTTSVSLSS